MSDLLVIVEPPAPLTIRALIAAYRSDPDSQYCKPEDDGGLRYRTKENYDSMMRRLETTLLPEPHLINLPDTAVRDINARKLRRLHEYWKASAAVRGHTGVAISHALIAMLRILATFGSTLLEDADCRALKALLRDMRFENAKPRKVYVTADQSDAVRVQARREALDSMALAQALQFECAFRQKDIIGEWVPNSANRIPSDVTMRGWKWQRGIRWERIDENLILRHTTSKRQKEEEPDLKIRPMVIEELERLYPGLVIVAAVYDDEGEIVSEMIVDRSKLPASGPVIVHEESGRPYVTHTFRRRWRLVARAAGIPDDTQSRDNRAGAASEATIHGANLEDAQHLLGHSQISTTAIYSRGKSKKATKAQHARVAGRNRDAAKKPKLIPYFGPDEGSALN